MAAKREIEAKMEVLPIGKPWFGPVVAQDENGCYQIILYKSRVSGIENREAMVTIVTFVKRRQVTYTRATPYFNERLTSFVKMVQSEVATFVELNPYVYPHHHRSQAPLEEVGLAITHRRDERTSRYARRARP